MKRLITALILMPLVWAVIFRGPEWLFLLVVGTVAALCFVEFVGIVRAHGYPLSYLVGISGLLFPLVQHVARFPGGTNLSWLALTVPAVLIAILMLIRDLRLPDLALVLPTAGAAVLSTVYVIGPWWAAVALHDRSPHWLLFALASNWVGDSAAYFAGRAFGRRKLAPRISPGKSWEGTIAAWLATIAFAVLYLTWAFPMPYWAAALTGAVVNPAGQLGDLVESALKRGAGMKDSSNLLPGHGGWLDRLDSSLFTLPVTLLLVLLLGG